jgi:hypothetical protein
MNPMKGEQQLIFVCRPNNAVVFAHYEHREKDAGPPLAQFIILPSFSGMCLLTVLVVWNVRCLGCKSKHSHDLLLDVQEFIIADARIEWRASFFASDAKWHVTA